MLLSRLAAPAFLDGLTAAECEALGRLVELEDEDLYAALIKRQRPDPCPPELWRRVTRTVFAP